MDTKKYLDLEDMKRDFTLMSRAINKQLQNLDNYKKLYKDIGWLKQFVKLITTKNYNKPIYEVHGHLQQLNDLRFYFETISSMLQQVQNDFPADIKSKNLSRNRLIKDCKELGQKLNEVINTNLALISDACKDSIPDIIFDVSKFLPYESRVDYKIFFVDPKNEKHQYTIIRLFNVIIEDYRIDQLTIYIKHVNGDYKILVQEGFDIPGFEAEDAYVSAKDYTLSNTFKKILIAQRLLRPNEQEIDGVISEDAEITDGKLALPLEQSKILPKNLALRVSKQIVSKLKQNKIKLNPTFKLRTTRTTNYLMMDFGDVLLSDTTADIIQRMFGLSQSKMNNLILSLEQKSNEV